MRRTAVRKPTGIFRPIGMALVLAIGFGSVFGIVVAWGVGIYVLFSKGTPQVYFENESLLVRSDGTPLIEHNAFFTGLGGVATYHAIDGNEVPGPKKIDENYWIQGSPLAVGGDMSFPWNHKSPFRGLFIDGQTPLTNCTNLFFLEHNGRAYFVGYDRQSKLCVGFIGREGLRPNQPPADQWFPIDGDRRASGKEYFQYAGNDFWNATYRDDGSEPQNVALICGAQLLGIDLRKGTVTTFMESADLMDMIDIKDLRTVSTLKAVGEGEPVFHSQTRLVGRTADRVIVLGARGKQRSVYLLPEELRDRKITFYLIDGGTALITSDSVLSDRRQRLELTWIDASGKVLRRAEASLIGVNGRSDEPKPWMYLLAVPSPVILAFIATVVVPFAHLSQGLATNYSTELAQSPAEFWPVLLVSTLLSAALAGYCFRRHRRYYQPFGGVWFVFVLLAGLPGLVGYLFHRRWPILEKCPACGQVVPRDRDTCAKCGAAFPPPALKGCEVFA
jgi:hypothetical protein